LDLFGRNITEKGARLSIWKMRNFRLFAQIKNQIIQFMKHLLSTLLVLIVVFAACKKDNCIENPQIEMLKGTWQVAQVDSGYAPVYYLFSYHPIDTLDLTGTLTFGENNTGTMDGSVNGIACGMSDFLWVYEDSLKTINFIFNENYTKGVVQKLTEDSLVFQFKNYCYEHFVMGSWAYYNLVLVKE
jgi:hypothetical protein